MLGGRGPELAAEHAGLHAGSPRRRVDGDAAHAFGLDQDDAVQRGQGIGAVPACPAPPRAARWRRRTSRRRDVGRALGERDGGRPLVGGQVPGLAGGVPAVLAGPDDGCRRRSSGAGGGQVRRWSSRHGKKPRCPSPRTPRRWRCSSTSSGSTPSTRPATSARLRNTSPACSTRPASRRPWSARSRSARTSWRACAGARTGRCWGCSRTSTRSVADPAGWRHDPWSGALDDGHVWGRGAIDMKSQTAAEVVAACSLAREGWRPARGDLLVISVSDEEVDGTGAECVTAEHPELVRCDYLLNEGGGESFSVGGERFYSVSHGREGRLPLHAHDRRRGRPRLGADASPTTRCSSSPRCSTRSPSASPAGT